jgi:hypothetical protein
MKFSAMQQLRNLSSSIRLTTLGNGSVSLKTEYASITPSELPRFNGVKQCFRSFGDKIAD